MATLRPDHDPRDKTLRDLAAVAKRNLYRAQLALGRDWKRYGRWILIDRRKIEPDRVVYCASRPGTGWVPNADEAFGDKALERDPDDSFEFCGRTIYKFRYQTCFGAIVEYNPLPEAVKVERRAKRKAKLIAEHKAAELKRYALFADQISQDPTTAETTIAADPATPQITPTMNPRE